MSSSDNPYQSPVATTAIDPDQRAWKGGADAVLAGRGLLHRKVIVNRPIEVTIEYMARGLSDRIIVDGNTVVSLLPIIWLYERFDFEIPYRDGTLPATVRLKLGHALRMKSFEIEINGVVAYSEEPGELRTSPHA